MNPARERFVAFAFCWADILIELDKSHKVLFSGGATNALLGVDAGALVGQDFMNFVAPKDKVLVEQLLRMTTKKGRIDNVTIRLNGSKGLTAPMAFAGYMLPDLKDHYFLALRTRVHIDEKGQAEEGVSRDKDSGLLAGDAFSQMAVKKLQDAQGDGAAAEMTLVNLPGFENFYESLNEEEREVLLNTVGTT